MGSTRVSAFADLYAKRPPSLIKPGLSRIEKAQRFLAGLGLETPSVLIAGTNGKGSTAAYLWRLISLSGRRSGLFTSPHLVSYSERFQVTGVTMNDEVVEAALQSLRARLPEDVYEAMSFFEVSTLLAFDLFKSAGCAVNVLEVGLGGRLDSTNVSDPLCSAIVSIGSDHKEFLGSMPAQIAREKAGVMRPGRPVFWGGAAAGPPEAHAEIHRCAEAMGCPVYESGETFGWVDQERFFVALPHQQRLVLAFPEGIRGSPRYLQHNFIMAFAMYVFLSHQKLCVFHPEIIQEFSRSSLPWAPCLRGRFESMVTPGGVRLLLDVCHNVEGAQAFTSALRASSLLSQSPTGRLPGLVSILKDKDISGILRILREVLDPVFLFALESDRSLDQGVIQRQAPEHGDLPVFLTWDSAFAAAESRWRGLPQPWVVCGSVVAVGHVLTPDERISMEVASATRL